MNNDASMEQLNEGKAKVSSGFKDLIKGAEEFLHSATSGSSDGMAEARARFQSQLENIKTMAADWNTQITDKYKQVSEQTDQYVQENPWRSVGIAAAVGLLVGVLAARR